MTTKRNANTVDRILDEAEKLVQVRGFNAFSYADISKAVGIQKASLHHHFATKTDLGVALVARYRRVFGGALETIESKEVDAVEQLERYVELYRSVLRKRRMCMCGMLAADVATLPDPIRASVAEFFSENVAWLTRVLSEGKKRGQLRYDGTAGAMASFIVSSLEGAMLVSRGSGELAHLDDVAGVLIGNLRAEKPKPRRATKPR